MSVCRDEIERRYITAHKRLGNCTLTQSIIQQGRTKGTQLLAAWPSAPSAGGFSKYHVLLVSVAVPRETALPSFW